jgi:hypothetical protein
MISILFRGGYTRVDTPTQIRRMTRRYVLRHTKTFKKHMLCMVVFLIYTYFECVASESFMKDHLRAENDYQWVCWLGNGVETIPTIYFPPSHHSSQHPDSCSHNFILCTKMSTDGDVSLLDSLSSCALNDFRDELAKPRYSH